MNELTTSYIAYIIILLIFSLLMIVEQWILFKKFNKKGFLSIIPIANTWTLFTIAGLPGWLQFIPVANIVGYITVPFMLSKKVNKSAALGLVSLIAPPVFYLIIILSVRDNKVVVEQPNNNINQNIELQNNMNQNIEIQPQNIQNNINQDIVNQTNFMQDNINPSVELPNQNIEQPIENNFVAPTPKINEFEEQPALNMEETVIENKTINNNSYVNIKPEEQPQQNTELEDITNIFEMPLPVPENQTINQMEQLETIEEPVIEPIKNINSGEPLIPTLEELDEIVETSSTELDKDILEETVELPKMINEEINSGITATKKCHNCGFENNYTEKTCTICGEQLM